MKPIKRRDVLKMLADKGFVFESEGRHPIYKNPATGQRVPVPNGRTISPGTMRDLLRFLNSEPTNNSKVISKVAD